MMNSNRNKKKWNPKKGKINHQINKLSKSKNQKKK